MKTAYSPQFAPFESSKLRFESSPSVPASPLFRQCKQLISHQSPDTDSREARISGQKPHPPMFWTWFCHLCQVHYSLGVTRTCLNDGHSVCRGRAVTKYGKIARRSPCHKEFDYVGWRIWGRWSRHNKEIGSSQTYGGRTFLHQCNFPADCMGENGYYSLDDDETKQHDAWTTVEANRESWTPRF